jgi:hypothetical protein
MRGFVLYMNDTVELPAWSMVALALLSGEGEGKDKRVKVLYGRCRDVEEALGMLLEHIKEIEERGLYHLRTRKL